MSPTTVFSPASSPARMTFDLSLLVRAVCAVIFVVVCALLIYALVPPNHGGGWNQAYHQTAWFHALCAAVFLAVLWGLYRFRVRQLRSQEARLREVIETIPAIAWIARPDGATDFVNGRWRQYTGLSPAATADRAWQAAGHPDDMKRHGSGWQTSLATGEPFEGEARFRRADGEYRWFLVRAVPFRDTRGRILKWYGVATDVEDRRRAQQLESDLAHVNRVSTLGELSAALAHELKQPITAAMANAEACLRWIRRDQPDLEEAAQAVARIVSDGTRASEIIDRLRSLYKKSPPRREPVDVNAVALEILELLPAHRSSIYIRTELGEGLPRIEADRVQLQQVLMNLTLNAIDAMTETGGDLTIRSQLGEDGRLLVSVSDSGVGLPTEQVGDPFKAFFTTKPDGSGMGLTISRSIVESHGGHLWATGNDGPGATFHFTLPIPNRAVEKPAAQRGVRGINAAFSTWT
jgi:PAS domain S-box-containing protein